MVEYLSESEEAHLIIARVAGCKEFQQRSDGSWMKIAPSDMYIDHPVGTVYHILKNKIR